MRALITGVNGFVGPYLAARMLERDPGLELWGLAWGGLGRAPLASLAPRLAVVDGDLTDPRATEEILAEIRPELVFHLAAASSVAGSWRDPATVYTVNLLGQLNLFEALDRLRLAPTVVVASSAEIYGRVAAAELPIAETAPIRPVTPYGVSKAAQDLLAYQVFAARALPTIRLRLFNHTGPRRPDAFFASSFARQLVEIERGTRPPRLEVGDLEVVRDLSDVRDVVEAYRLAAERGRPGDAYNVCSGRPVRVGEVLDRLLALARLEVEVVVDEARLRAVDIPVQYGDPSRLAATTGWRPEIALEQTLADLLDWWRGDLEAAAP